METPIRERPAVGVREVFVLAWPIMVSMLSRTAMTTADSLFVARLGTEPLAAVGLAGVASFVGLAFGMGLLSGLKVVASQTTGAGDHDRARRLVWQGGYLALGVGLAVMALAPLGPVLFPVLGASDAVGELASGYYAVRLLGAPLVFLSWALTGWFQGRGDTRTPMVAAIGANALNIALDPLLIFGWGPVPALGLQGAALATNIGVAAGLVFLLWRARKEASAWVRPVWSELRAVIRMGAPIAVHWTLDVVAFSLFVSVLARVGDAHLAAHVIVMRLVSVSFMPGHAVGEAAGVLVGQAVGAGEPRRARSAFRSALWLAVGIMGAMGLVFVAVPGPLVQVFGASDAVQAVAVQLMWIAAGFQVFDAVAMVAFGALRGAGDTRFTMWMGIVCAWAIKLPLGVLLALPVGLGAAGAWLGLTVEIAVIALVGVLRIRGTAWLAAADTQEPESDDSRLAAK